MSLKMKTKALVSLILIASCLTSWAWFDPSITQAKINQIRIGQTTEADLVHFFGHPTTRHIDLRHHVTLDFIRSVPMPWQGYIPFIGSFIGGLDLDAQELWVELTPDGRVLRYRVFSSRNDVKTSTTTTRTTVVNHTYSK
jgi:hypothetical protein